ncbi:alpha/beta hydrolase family protein [Stygiolobus azoricus]|uniref:Alpha/beta fold hydrolase n=1 Tax=Stygiolobus azoricus TaxID=41675 RepID=A0A650CRH8_9CREN|nr:S9 family peptidase [Stygiolobus azoricus]QGR20426.1 alpha/beta fold hydrolase [Stygiolobus azoricus]
MDTVEEAYSIRLISEVKLGEKGLLHTETWIEGNEYKSSIYLNKRRITFGGKESLPTFNGEDLYYVLNGRTLVRQSPYGESKRLFTLGKIHKFVFHKDGILVIGEKKDKKEGHFVAKKLKYRFDGRGLLRTRMSLFLFDGKKVRTLVEGDFDVTDVATNGKRIVISATKENDDVGLSDVYEVEGNELRKITRGEGIVSAVAMNDDGQIAYLGHRKGKAPWAVKEVILPEEDKSYLCGNYCGNSVLTDLFDGAKEKLVFSRGEIVTTGQVGGKTNVYKISDNKVEQLTDGDMVVRNFDYLNGELVYVYTTPEKPSLMQYKGEIYDPNPLVRGLKPELVKGDIEGWAIIVDKNAPTILFIHGGPHTAYGYSYFIEFQFFAKHGFNVIYSNPRGSQGYGEDFAKACVGDWGGKDMEDILNFVKTVKEKYGLTGKIGVTGGSYGGFMTNWIITKTDMFSAAISERSISNLVSMCGTSDIGFWFNTIESGIDDPWKPENMDKLMKMSPIYYVKNVKTPTMLIHGEEDYRCPIEQAEQFFIALKMNGIDSELVRYKGDGHEHARRGKPNNMKDRLRRKLEWFNKYLR